MPRVRIPTMTDQAAGEAAQAFFLTNFGKFSAEEAAPDTPGDGEQSTNVTISAAHGSGETWTIHGATGHCGHAEMHALSQVLAQYGPEVDMTGMILSCESKPCCAHCSTILGALGIVATQATLKSPRAMGSTSWGMPGDLKAWFCGKTGMHPKAFEVFCNTRWGTG